MAKKGVKKPQKMHEIEAEYITTNQSLTDLAKKYGMTRQSLADESSRSHWVAKRNAYRTQVRDGAVNLCIQRDTKALQLIVSNSVNLLHMIQSMIDDPESFRRYIAVETTRDGDEQTSQQVERVFKRIDTQSLKQVVDSQKVIMDGLYKLFGIPTQAEEAAQKIASERLQLDKAKMEAEAKSESEGVLVRMDLPEGVDA